MNLGVGFIALSVVALLASFTMDVPSWVNLLGIIFGVVGLLLLGRGRMGGNGDGN